MLSPPFPKLSSGLWHSSHFHRASRLPWHVFLGELETCLMFGELTWHALVGEPKTCLHVRGIAPTKCWSSSSKHAFYVWWTDLTFVGHWARNTPSWCRARVISAYLRRMSGRNKFSIVLDLGIALHDVRWIDLTCVGCSARNMPSCLVNSRDVCLSLSSCELTRRLSVVKLMWTDSTCVGCWAHVNWLYVCQLPSSCELTRRV